MQRIINEKDYMYHMQYNGDGTGQILFALDACRDEHSEFVDVRCATSRNSSTTMAMSPDVALAAYQWLGRWLQTQGVKLPAPDVQLPARR